MHVTEPGEVQSRCARASAPSDVVVELFGVRFVVSGDDSVLEQVARRLPPEWTPADSTPPDSIPDRTYRFTRCSAGGKTGYQLRADDALLTRSADLADLCERFQSDLELFA